MRVREAFRLFLRGLGQEFTGRRLKGHSYGGDPRHRVYWAAEFNPSAGWLWSKRKRPGTGMVLGLAYEPT